MSEMTFTSFDEKKCLQINPFEGDFGSAGDRILSDKVVTARVTTHCSECRTPTIKGERVRVITALFDGAMQSFRVCSACCDALIAYSFEGDYSKMDLRNEVRRVNLEAEVVLRGQQL